MMLQTLMALRVRRSRIRILEAVTRLPTYTQYSLTHMVYSSSAHRTTTPRKQAASNAAEADITYTAERKFSRTERGLVKAFEEESETLQNITDYFTLLMKKRLISSTLRVTLWKKKALPPPLMIRNVRVFRQITRGW